MKTTNNLLKKYGYIINEMKNVCKDNDKFKEIKSLFKEYFELLGDLDYNDIEEQIKLNKLKSTIFEFEKHLLPLLEVNKNLQQREKLDILILTVGMQKEPIILSILCLKPEIVYLLHTNSSQKIAEEVRDDVDIKNLNIQINFERIEEDDLIANYRIINEILMKNKDKSIICDPTGGRKMMNTSLSLLSLYYRIPMIYLHGIEIKRQIVPFSSRIKVIENPFEIFGDVEMNLIQNLFNSHFYESATKVCETLLNTVKDPYIYLKIECLQELISVYRDWDRFEHSNPNCNPKLSEKLKNIRNKFLRFKFESLLPKNIDNNIKFLKEIEKEWKKGKVNMIDKYRIIDIFLNATRRGSIKQGKYDDAIARLYRLIEMICTYYLLNFGISSTQKPKYENLVKNLKTTLNNFEQKFEEMNEKDLPQEKIGLDNQINILNTIISFKDDEKVKNLIKIYYEMTDLIRNRNRSILAHGTVPLGEKEWSEFKKKIEIILIQTFNKYEYNELTELGMHRTIDLKCGYMIKLE